MSLMTSGGAWGQGGQVEALVQGRDSPHPQGIAGALHAIAADIPEGPPTDAKFKLAPPSWSGLPPGA